MLPQCVWQDSDSQEYIITGYIEEQIHVHTTGIIKAPNDRSQLSQTGILLARTVVGSDRGDIPFRVFSPMVSQRVIKKGMGLGYLTTIADSDVQETQLSYVFSNTTLQIIYISEPLQNWGIRRSSGKTAYHLSICLLKGRSWHWT